MSQIKKVIARANYCLEILLDNGSSVTLSLESRLATMRFAALSNPSLFSQVDTDGIYIRWGKKVEMSIDEVFQLAQK